MSIDVGALISKAREQFEQAEPVDQEILVGDELVTVRVRPVTGQAWRDLAAEHPPRFEADGRTVMPVDRMFGFNLDALITDYPGVTVRDGDDEIPMTADEWRDLVSTLEAPSIEALRLAVWGMNVFTPGKKLAEAGKASAGGRKKKRRSPVSSASQSGN